MNLCSSKITQNKCHSFIFQYIAYMHFLMSGKDTEQHKVAWKCQKTELPNFLLAGVITDLELAIGNAARLAYEDNTIKLLKCFFHYAQVIIQILLTLLCMYKCTQICEKKDVYFSLK